MSDMLPRYVGVTAQNCIYEWMDVFRKMKANLCVEGEGRRGNERDGTSCEQ
jgi:hypothetical protein